MFLLAPQKDLSRTPSVRRKQVRRKNISLKGDFHYFFVNDPHKSLEASLTDDFFDLPPINRMFNNFLVIFRSL
jgi:hypothetical protein